MEDYGKEIQRLKAMSDEVEKKRKELSEGMKALEERVKREQEELRKEGKEATLDEAMDMSKLFVLCCKEIGFSSDEIKRAGKGFSLFLAIYLHKEDYEAFLKAVDK